MGLPCKDIPSQRILQVALRSMDDLIQRDTLSPGLEIVIQEVPRLDITLKFMEFILT